MLLGTTRKTRRASTGLDILDGTASQGFISYESVGWSWCFIHWMNASGLLATGVGGGSSTCLKIASKTVPADFAKSP